jgi:steroid 5-alpha reductase family enzyme
MSHFETHLVASAIAAVAVFLALQFTVAPYGRYAQRGPGPSISSRAGWIVMESVAMVAILYFFLRQRPPMTPTLWVLIGLWELHYVNRSIVYPLRMRTRGKANPLSIVVLAAAFNTWNGYLNGHWLGVHALQYTSDWMLRPQFLLGAAVFASGLAVNVWSDEILLRLRRDSATAYSIPRGGLFRFVSCPNYLGELIEWSGWALMAWSPAALVFVLWTAANLVPRARSHHRWYRREFPDYPADRKAIVPFIY